MALSWNESYNLGIKIIDEQHKKFVTALSQLIEALNKGHDIQSEVDKVFKSIDDYASNHFSTEEIYFAKFNYAGAGEHIAEHQKFRSKLTEINAQYLNDTISGSFNLADFLEDWLVKHLSNMDKKYVACFHEHGLY